MRGPVIRPTRSVLLATPRAHPANTSAKSKASTHSQWHLQEVLRALLDAVFKLELMIEVL